MAISVKQRLGGLVLSFLGAGGSVGIWHEAVHNGLLYEKASVLFPSCLVMGIAAMFLQNYKEERLARGEDISKLRGWKLLTPAWRGVLIAALLVGFGNYLILRLSFSWAE